MSLVSFGEMLSVGVWLRESRPHFRRKRPVRSLYLTTNVGKLDDFPVEQVQAISWRLVLNRRPLLIPPTPVTAGCRLRFRFTWSVSSAVLRKANSASEASMRRRDLR